MIRKSAVLFFLFSFLIRTTFAQTATFSPYSRYGIGELLYNGYGWQRSMGGIAVGTWNASHLNFTNPAGNANDTVTIFEIGLNGEAINIANSNASQDRMNAGISYLSMGFPLKKGQWYLNMGLLPLSTVGYNIKQTVNQSLPGNAYFYYTGKGGYNRYYASTSLKLLPNLWAGVTGSYIYGTTNRSSKVEFQESGYMNTRITNTITLKGFYAEAGLMYNKQLRNGNLFTVGATFSPSMDVKGRKDELWLNYLTGNLGLELRRDTVSFVSGEKGAIRFPMIVGTGFSFSRENKWTIGFDARYYQWKDLDVFGENNNLNNSMRLSSGMQWTPNSKSTNYFEKITYRIGGYFSSPDLVDQSSILGGIFQSGKAAEHTTIAVKTSDITEKGISFGFGFPLRGKPYFSDLDIGFELSERGTIESNLVRERYFRMILGLTIREEWFQKARFD